MKNLFLVVAAAALMSLGWLEVSGLFMLVGLVPLLLLADGMDRSARSLGKMAGLVVLFITLWYGATVWWVWFATPAGPIAATFFAWIFTGGALVIWFWISKRAPRALSYTILVAVWILGEWVYAINQASFPWLNIGNGFAHDTWAVQWYEWTGVYGGTLWVLVTNILVYEFVILRRRWLAPALAIIVPLAVSLTIFWTYEEPSRKATVTIVQPNMDPYLDVDPEIRLANLVALEREAPSDAAFVVMPEGGLDDAIAERTIGFSSDLAALREAAPAGATVVVGATTYTAQDVYNTAIALSPTGGTDLHHKAKLVIGTEMMPTWWWMKYLKWVVKDLDSYVGQLGYGTERRVFTNGEIYAGAGICWESLFGEYFTEFVQNGAEVLFVITNDGWWRDTPGHRQHFDYSRLRAIETRRAVARSANTGRSGFITPRGDVGQTLQWGERGVITDEVSVSRRLTFYARFGDWVCRLSLLVFCLSVLYLIAYLVKRRDLR